MLGEEGKEEKAEVSKSNKSSNAEQFLPVQSGSVELIFNPETGLCLVALAVGRRVQSSDQAPPDRSVCPDGASKSSSAGLLEDASQQRHGRLPELDLQPDTHFHSGERNR